MKEVITAQDVRDLRGTGPIEVTRDVVMTPSALDEAYSRGIEVVFRREGYGPSRGAGPVRPEAAAPAAPRVAGGLAVRLPEAVGRTYVVKVTDAGPVVFESTPDGLRKV